MIKILSTGLNYPHVNFYTRDDGSADNFTCYIEQYGSGNYVANCDEHITLYPPDDDESQTYVLFINETNYEMKLHNEQFGDTHTLAPRGGSILMSNPSEEVYHYNITYTSPNPPPQTVNVQAIIMG